MSTLTTRDDTYQLAEELATITGESVVAAVNAAVRERLARVRQQRKAGLTERWLAIGRETRARLREPWRSIDHAELLYDEFGLPR